VVRKKREAAAICGLAVFLWMAIPVWRGELLWFDLPLREAIHEWASPALTAVMRIITTIGSEYLLIPLAAVVVWHFERRFQRRSAYVLLLGGLSAEVLCELLKSLFERPRPELFFGLPPAVNYSFPSGHSFVPAVYFGIIAVTLKARVQWRVAIVAMAGLVGISRVYLGYHYPSDVVAGWSLALLWMSLWSIVGDRRGASPALSRRKHP
jgi:undecaprenyl-diphosphatase